MKILAIQNCEIEGFGLYKKYFIDHGMKYQIIHAYQNYSFPELNLFDAIFIGATPISAYEAHKYPFFRWNKVVGAQFHLEVTSHDVTKWAEEYAQELVEIGKSKEQVRD